MFTFSSLASISLLFAATSRAALDVTCPTSDTVCTGGEPCWFQWTDDGTYPPLSLIGEAEIVLWFADPVPVQTLPPANLARAGSSPSSSSSTSTSTSTNSSSSTPSSSPSALRLRWATPTSSSAPSASSSFVPFPSDGPNGQYFLSFTSLNIAYQYNSSIFNLTGMTGTCPTPISASMPTPTPTPTATSPAMPGTPAMTGTANGGLTNPNMTATTTTTTTTTTTASKLTSSTSVSSTASATPASSAAGRVASSVSLGGIVVLFVLTGALVF